VILPLAPGCTGLGCVRYRELYPGIDLNSWLKTIIDRRVIVHEALISAPYACASWARNGLPWKVTPSA